MTRKPYRNPFYFLLVLAGTIFVITAFSYGFLAFQSLHADPAEISRHQDHPLWVWLNSHGTIALLAELSALGVFTVAAMGTDRFWDARQSNRNEKA